MVHMDSIFDEESHTARSQDEYGDIVKTPPTSPTINAPLSSDSNSIILYPFAHQVGGHTQLLTLDKSTLCKPLIPRELLFYLNVPKELAKFVPAYKGVVQIRETGQGTYPSLVYQPLRSPKSQHSAKYRLGVLELKVQIRPCPDEKVLKKNLSQDNLLKADYISRPNEKYLLLLENVASKYKLPCILDLKMGTRQHGDDATEEKRHRQIAKCQASTSASLGVRLCGMQVYQVDYGGFLWYDKYLGRQMNEDGLKRALHEYFRNGSQLNADIIDDVIDRLKLLSDAIEKSPSFRFYGTSLLIIHEGCATSRDDDDDKDKDHSNQSNSNLSDDIDVSTTTTSTTINTNTGTNTMTVPAEYDDDVTLVRPEASTAGVISDSTNANRATLANSNKIFSNDNNNTTSTKNINNKTSKSKRCQVDVRLIDFAHTICDYSYTNGRSSSSPSVLTSSSAEQLSASATTTTTATASSLLVPPQKPPKAAMNLLADANHCAISNQIRLEPNHNNLSRNHNHNHNQKQNQNQIHNDDHNADQHNDDTENNNPTNQRVDTTLGATLNEHSSLEVELVENEGENNNNAINVINNNNSTSNINGLTNAFKPNITASLTSSGKPYNSNSNFAETLREVDQQQHQINSTPTSPPSLGVRKISKSSLGPDKGLLFGLENLMRLLDDLKTETLLTC